MTATLWLAAHAEIDRMKIARRIADCYWHQWKRKGIIGFDYDELVNVAWIGMADGEHQWNPGCGFPLSAVLHRVAARAVLAFCISSVQIVLRYKHPNDHAKRAACLALRRVPLDVAVRKLEYL